MAVSPLSGIGQTLGVLVSWSLGLLVSLLVFGSLGVAGLFHFSILLKSLNYATFRGRDVSRDP